MERFLHSHNPSMNLSIDRNDPTSVKLLLEDITASLDVNAVLSGLGVPIDSFKESYGELRGPCPIHSGDNPTAFRFSRQSKHFSCFSKQCHEMYGSDLVGFVRALKSCTFIEAIQFLCSLSGRSYLDLPSREELSSRAFLREVLDDGKRKETLREKISQASPNLWSDVKLKRSMDYRSSYYESRGFLKETLDFFEVGGCEYADGHRDIIPIRDVHHSLVGVSSRLARDVSKDEKIPKYKVLEDFEKGDHLYGLNSSQDFSRHFRDTLILVEGFTDVWRLWEAGIPIGVSCMGTSITPTQRFLLTTRALQVLIFFDGDPAGLKGQEIVSKRLNGFVKVLTYNKKDIEPSKLDCNSLRELVYDLIMRR